MRAEPMPQWLGEIIARAYTATAEKVKLEASVELDTDASLAQALAYLAEAPASVVGQGGNDNAYKVAARLKDIGVSEGVALDCMDLLSDWNSRCSPPWDRDELEEVVGHAYDYGENSPGSASIELEFDIIPEDWADLPDIAPARDTLQFLTDSDIKRDEGMRRKPIIKGIIAEGDIACIYGRPGSGKSLIAPYIGRRVAQGEFAFGKRTRQGKVFYVAAEDEYGMAERIKALAVQYGETDEFVLVKNVSNLAVKNSHQLKQLDAAVAAQRPALIFIDTVAMAFPGIDENSAEGMGRVVFVGRKLAKYGGAVVFIHHDTKANGDTPRGHSVFDGALDMKLKLTRSEKDNTISGKLGKNRNGSLEWEPAFRIATKDFGKDADGDPVTVAYAEEIQRHEVKPRTHLTAAQKGALDILADMDSGGGVRMEDWRSACVDDVSRLSASETRASRRTAFQRALEGLLRAKAIIKTKGIVQLAGAVSDFDLIEDGAFPDDEVET